MGEPSQAPHGMSELGKALPNMCLLWQEWYRGWRSSDVHLISGGVGVGGCVPEQCYDLHMLLRRSGLYTLACTSNVRGTKKERGQCPCVHMRRTRLREGLCQSRLELRWQE